MSCARDSLTISGEGAEDLLGGLGPHKRLGVLVPGLDPGTDVGLQAWTLVCTPRWSSLVVSSAMKRSTWSSQDELVGRSAGGTAGERSASARWCRSYGWRSCRRPDAPLAREEPACRAGPGTGGTPPSGGDGAGTR